MFNGAVRAAALAAAMLVAAAGRASAGSIALQSAASGVTLGGTNTAATMNLGAGNGLGVGTAAAGVRVVSLAAGPVYASPFTISLKGWGTASITVTAYVSTNFVRGGGATPAISAFQCTATDCTASGNYVALSTSSASPSTVRTGLANNETFSTTLGALISYLNGGLAFTGSDTATLTIRAVNVNKVSDNATATLTITSTVQQAVQLSLDGAGGTSISTGGTTDYLMDFGTIDGLGVSAGSGATRATTSTGAMYSSSYIVRPEFSSMSSTAGTVRMYVSSNFTRTALVQLQHSPTGAAGTFSPVSLSSTAAEQTTIASSAQSKVDLTRYLGVFVFRVNGPSAYVGIESAVVTFTLIVP